VSTDASQRYGIFNCPNCGAAAGPESICCRYCGSSLATRVCASCFGAVSVGMNHCPWCGAGASEGETVAVDRKCPRCAQKLSQVNLSRHTILECLRCGGLWVDKSTFQEICARQEEQEAVLAFHDGLENAANALQFGTARVYIPCPECGKLMNRQNFAGCSHVILDWCREHGAWFDQSELHQIVKFIQNGGLKKAREKEKRQLEEEKSHIRQQQLNLSARTPSVEAAALASGWNEDTDSLLRVLSCIWRGLEK
jgi:Zn-finger nucleic acid-binding protein